MVAGMPLSCLWDALGDGLVLYDFVNHKVIMIHNFFFPLLFKYVQLL